MEKNQHSVIPVILVVFGALAAITYYARMIKIRSFPINTELE